MAAGALLVGCLPTYDDEPAAAECPSPPARSFVATVDRVVDGDTFVARRRGDRLRVRLIGVDAPESVRPGAPVECWGKRSSAVLRRLLPEGADVRAAYQAGGRQDRYDRELWDVWSGGRFVAAQLVRRGAARAVAYPPQVEHSDLLSRVEAAAAQDRVGLFGACDR